MALNSENQRTLNKLRSADAVHAARPSPTYGSWRPARVVGLGAIAVVAAILVLGPGVARAQVAESERPSGTERLREPAPMPLEGRVVTEAGVVVAGADVFLLETLEGAATDSLGRFRLWTGRRGPTTVVVRGLGYGEARVRVELPRAALLVVEVRVETVSLAPITVRAGAYAAGAGESAELTPLEVVSIPGSQADVLQAVAAFPGVQPVEEGAALFVRGGDVAETKVVLDGARVLAPYRFESGLMSFGTFDPFELEGISFSSGGFGVRHGDALSGLLELETRGVPERREAGVTASLAAVSAKLALPLGKDVGVRAALNRSSTGLLFRLNGYDTDFASVPESRNGSVSAAWRYRRGGRVKLYAYDEWNRFAVRVDEPAHEGAFTGEDGSRVAVASVRDAAGPVGVRASVSLSDRHERQSFGAFRLDERDDLAGARLELSASPAPGVVGRLGAEAEARDARVAGSYPLAASDPRPGARATAFASTVHATRRAAFAEAEWRPLERLQLAAGLRHDRSTLTGGGTWDPRVAGAYRLGDGAHLTFAWGRYHQLPAPLLYEPEVGDPSLPAMSATHTVVGVVVEGVDHLLRVEAYAKTQRELAQQDRTHHAVGAGRGSARGVDVFARGRGPLGLEGRVSYSFIDAERTDPDTGTLAPSPYGIRHALTAVLARGLGQRWKLATAVRHASGRPYTPVVDAVRDDSTGVWTPVYGAPWSERLAAYTRLDLSGQFLHSFGGEDIVVVFASVTNVLDRHNVAGVQYSADYSERKPLHSSYRRTFYFGVTTTLPF